MQAGEQVQKHEHERRSRDGEHVGCTSVQMESGSRARKSLSRATRARPTIWEARSALLQRRHSRDWRQVGRGCEPRRRGPRLRQSVWDFIDSNWAQKGSTLSGDADGDGFGSAVALSSSGSVKVVGAPNKDVGGNVDAGLVRGAPATRLSPCAVAPLPGSLASRPAPRTRSLRLRRQRIRAARRRPQRRRGGRALWQLCLHLVGRHHRGGRGTPKGQRQRRRPRVPILVWQRSVEASWAQTSTAARLRPGTVHHTVHHPRLAASCESDARGAGRFGATVSLSCDGSILAAGAPESGPMTNATNNCCQLYSSYSTSDCPHGQVD